MSSFSIKKYSKLLVPGTPSSGQNYWDYNGSNIYNSNSGNVGVNKATNIDYKLDVCGNINISTGQYFDISGVPINNNFYPALSYNNAIKDVSNISINERSIFPLNENSANGIAWSPELGLFVMVTQQGSNWRFASSPDGFNWTQRNTSFGVTLTNVTQFFLNNCAFAAPAPSLQVVCADTSGLEVGCIVGAGGVGTPSPLTNPYVTQILDASNFLTSFRPGSYSNPQATTLYTCNDTSGLVVGMGVSQSITTSVSPSARSLLSIPSSTKFILGASRSWVNATCLGERGYQGVVWCKDLSGVGMFVATAAGVPTGKMIFTSTDGINWVQRDTPPVVTGGCGVVCYSPELKRVVATFDGTDRGFIYSDDGINWTATLTSPYAPYYSLAWSPKLRLFAAYLVSAPNLTERIITSPDGITWTPRKAPFNSGSYSVITWSEQLGIFLGVVGPSVQVIISSNGIDWETVASPGITVTSFRPLALDWSPQLRCFLLGGNQNAWFSFNGTNWFRASITNASTNGGFKSAIWCKEKGFFILVGAAASSGLNATSGSVYTTTFRAAPPTYYNTFDSSVNFIANNTSNLWTFQSFGRGIPVIKTSNFSVAPGENWIICNLAGTITVTLPNANLWAGREIMIKTVQNQLVNSASANVVPLIGGAPGTAILTATTGKWATLVSDGSNWVIMRAN